MDSNTVAICIELLNVSSIAVTLNGRLDYYGASVNLAARLEGPGEAADITMQKTFASDPNVDTILCN
ncbi:MAG: class 3 adenylate cyclase [Rubritalea sp.]|jgi:class 3 adenylate cyclase